MKVRRGEPHQLEQLHDSLFPLRRSHALHGQGLGDGVKNGAAGVHRLVWILEDHLDPARNFFMSSRLMWATSMASLPSPSRIRPPVASISLTSILPVVVFPHPDSPTNPRLSPRSMLKLTPSTAWTKSVAARNSPREMGELPLQVLYL